MPTSTTTASLRHGMPEVIYCEGKTLEQIVGITKRMLKAGQRHPRDAGLGRGVQGDQEARQTRGLSQGVAGHRRAATRRRSLPRGIVLVLTAGTSDIPVAEEAAVTAETLGSTVQTVYDVGVAGIHRILSKKDILDSARVIVVVAGMDGALPSVVGGLVDKPVIAVPTSVGYGAGFHGLAPLLTMLNSCASGVAVMNIDNGFGAGVLAHRINLGGELT